MNSNDPYAYQPVGLNSFFPYYAEDDFFQQPQVQDTYTIAQAIHEDPNQPKLDWSSPYQNDDQSSYSSEDVKELFNYYMKKNASPEPAALKKTTENSSPAQTKTNSKVSSLVPKVTPPNQIDHLLSEASLVVPNLPQLQIRQVLDELLESDLASSTEEEGASEEEITSQMNKKLVSATTQLGSALRLDQEQVKSLTTFATTSARIVSKMQSKTRFNRFRRRGTSITDNNQPLRQTNRPVEKAGFRKYSQWLRSPTPIPSEALKSKDYTTMFPRAPSNEPNSLGEQCDDKHLIEQLGLPTDRPLSKSEQKKIKRQRRLIKNRESAHLSRLRKKAELEDLREQVEKLAKRNEYLESKLQSVMDTSSDDSDKESTPSVRRTTTSRRQNSQPENKKRQSTRANAFSFSLIVLILALGIYMTNGETIPISQSLFSSLSPELEVNSSLYTTIDSQRTPSPSPQDSIPSIYTGRTLQQVNEIEHGHDPFYMNNL